MLLLQLRAMLNLEQHNSRQGIISSGKYYVMTRKMYYVSNYFHRMLAPYYEKTVVCLHSQSFQIFCVLKLSIRIVTENIQINSFTKQ